MMQSSTTVKVHRRQSPNGGNHDDDHSSNHHHHHHNHPHSGSHSRRRRPHQLYNPTNNKKRQQLQQQPSTTIFFGGTGVWCDSGSGSGGGGGGYICSRYRHIIYVAVGIFFFVSVQVRLLIWGYHASKIPVQGSQHEPLSQYTDNQQQQQQQQEQNHDRQQQQLHQRRKRRESPDGYMNGFPIYYQDLTLDPTFHTRPYSQIHCVGENYQHHHKHHHDHPTGGHVDSEEESNNLNGNSNDDTNQSFRDEETAWMKKSCHYRFLCLNLTSHEFQMYNRPTLDTPLEKWSQQKKYADQNILDVSSSVMMTTTSQSKKTENGLKLNGVSLGAIDDDGNGLRWTPTVISDRPPPDKFYTLEDGVVFVPFFSIQGWDVKSLLWNDFFALYNLLHIFQFDDYSDIEKTTTTTTTEQHQQRQQYQPLLMRYVPSSDYSPMSIPKTSCDTSQAWYEQCQSMLHKYQSLMMMTTTTTLMDDKTADTRSGSSTISSSVQNLLTTQRDVVLQFSKTDNIQTKPDEQNPSLQSDLVCAKDGVAGIGPLTDHGTNEILTAKHSHHYRYANGVRSHNYSRGAVLWKFRRFCLQNLELLKTDRIDPFGQQPVKSHKMIVAKSTAHRLKWLVRPPTFNTILKQDEKSFVPKLHIEQYDFPTMDVKDSVEAIMDASVFVVGCIDRNDLIMSIFLPKGSSLIIYCDDDDETTNSDSSKSNINIYDDKTKNPKERDLLNNLSYVTVHWITTTSSDSQDTEVFEQLIWHELYRQATATAG